MRSSSVRSSTTKRSASQSVPRGAFGNSSVATYNSARHNQNDSSTAAGSKDFAPFSVGGYPRAQSLAGDYNAAANISLLHNNNNVNNTNTNTNNNLLSGNNAVNTPFNYNEAVNNNAKLRHLLRFINHRPESNKFDGPAENFFTGSKLVREITGVSAKCMACVGNTVWIGEKSGVLSVWDLQTGDLIKRKEAQRSRTFVTAVAGVGLYVWVGYSDGLVRIFDPDTLQLFKEIKEHSGAITQLLVSYNGLSVYSASTDFTIVQWDANSVERVAVLSGHKGGVRCLTTAVGLRLFSGGDDGQIIEWDVVRARPRHILANHHRGSVRALTATAGHLWSGGEDGTVRLWSLTNETSGGATSAAPSPLETYRAAATLPPAKGGATAGLFHQSPLPMQESISVTSISPTPTPNSALRPVIPTQQNFGGSSQSPRPATPLYNHNQNQQYQQTTTADEERDLNNDTANHLNSNHRIINEDDGIDGPLAEGEYNYDGEEEYDEGNGTAGDAFDALGLQDVDSTTNDQLLAAVPICVHIITNPHTAAITSLVIVGSYVWSSSGSKLYMWNSETFALEGEFNQKDGTGGTAAHSLSSTLSNGHSPSSPSSGGGFITCLAAVHQSVIARLWTCGSEGTVKMWNSESRWSSAFKAAQDEHVQRMELLLNANADREQQLEAGYERLHEATIKLKGTHDELTARVKAAETENETLKTELEEALNANSEQATELSALREKLRKLKKRLPQNKFERNLRSLLRGVCQSHQDVYGAEDLDSDDEHEEGDDDATTPSKKQKKKDADVYRHRSVSEAAERPNVSDDEDLDSVINYSRHHAKSAPLVEAVSDKKDKNKEGGDGSLANSVSAVDTTQPQVFVDSDEKDLAQNDEDGYASTSSNASSSHRYARLIRPRFAAFDLVACAKLQEHLENLRQLHTDPFKGEDEVAFRWRHGDYRYGDPKEFAGEEDTTKGNEEKVLEAEEGAPNAATIVVNNNFVNNNDNNTNVAINNNNNTTTNNTINNKTVQIHNTSIAPHPALTATHTVEAQQNLVRLEVLALQIQMAQLNKQTKKASVDLKDLVRADAETLRTRFCIGGNDDYSHSHDALRNNNVSMSGPENSSVGDESHQRTSPRQQSVGAATALTPRRKAAAAVLAAISGDNDNTMDAETDEEVKEGSSFSSPLKNNHHHSSPSRALVTPEGVALIDIDEIEEEDLRILMNIKKRALLASAAEAKAEKQRKSEKRRESRKLKEKLRKEKAKERALRIRNGRGGDDDFDDDDDGSRSDDSRRSSLDIENDSSSSSEDEDDGLLGATTTLQLVMKKYNYNPEEKSTRQVALQALLNLSEEDMAALYMGPIPCPTTLNDNDKAMLSMIRLKYSAVTTATPTEDANSSSSAKYTYYGGKEGKGNNKKGNGGDSAAAADLPRLIAVRTSAEANAPLSVAALGYLTSSELRSEELEALKKIAKKFRHLSGEAPTTTTSSSKKQKHEEEKEEENRTNTNNSKNTNPATRRVRNLEAIVLRHCPTAVTLPPLAVLPRRDLNVVYSIYKKYRASVVDLKPEDEALSRNGAEDKKRSTAGNKDGSPLRFGALQNSQEMMNVSSSNKKTATDDDDDDTRSRRSGATIRSSRRGGGGPKLYNPQRDYPSLPSGVSAVLLRLRADVESSLATVLQQQTKTRNELGAMALELAEARELLSENDELRQLLIEGEDKDEMRRAKRQKRREEKENKKAAKAARKAARLLAKAKFEEEEEIEDGSIDGGVVGEEKNKSSLTQSKLAGNNQGDEGKAGFDKKKHLSASVGAASSTSTGPAAASTSAVPIPTSHSIPTTPRRQATAPPIVVSARTSPNNTPRRTNSSGTTNVNGNDRTTITARSPRLAAATTNSPIRSRTGTPVAPARVSDLRR